MAARLPNPLDQARAEFVLSSIAPDRTRLNWSWYEGFHRLGVSRAALDRALNQLAAGGKIVIEAGQHSVCAWRVESGK